MHICIHAFVCVYVRMYVRACICMDVCTYACTYIHMHARTHTCIYLSTRRARVISCPHAARAHTCTHLGRDLLPSKHSAFSMHVASSSGDPFGFRHSADVRILSPYAWEKKVMACAVMARVVVAYIGYGLYSYGPSASGTRPMSGSCRRTPGKKVMACVVMARVVVAYVVMACTVMALRRQALGRRQDLVAVRLRKMAPEFRCCSYIVMAIQLWAM